MNMNVSVEILQPVVALVGWSMVMWTWMYVTRIPAVRAAKLELDPLAPRGEQMSTLPPRVRWKADNYNHLMEQPTIFYALMFYVTLTTQTSMPILYAAWAYVALRVLHSLIQVSSGKVVLRFGVFSLSTLVLIGMVVLTLI